MKRITTFFLALVLTAGSAMGQIVDPNSLLEKDPNVRQGKLDNGLTYYLRHNEKPAGRADFYLATNIGAIQETKAQDGLAHFLEHMALNGTKNLPGKMMLEYFQSIGVEFGRNINAGTGVEQTYYMIVNTPVHRQGIIDTALLIMHDYSGYVSNEHEEIDKERGVIVEEWRTRRTASWRMHEQELEYLYKGSKYAECTLIGSKENLETFPYSELESFYYTWYRPDLQALIVVGDIDVDAIEAQIKKLYEDIPARVNPEPKVLPAIPNNEEPIVGIITDPENNTTSVSVYFKQDPLPDQIKPYGAAYLSDLVNNIIYGVLNERLNDIASLPNAPFISAGSQIGPICNAKDAFVGEITCKDNEPISAFTALMKEFEKLKRYGITDAEYERFKTNMLRGLEVARDNADSRQNGQLVNPLLSNFLFGQPYMSPEYEYNLAKGYFSILSPAQINQMLTTLDFSRNAVVIYKGVEKEGNLHPTEAQLVEVLSSMGSMEIEAPIADEVMEPLVDDSMLIGSPVKSTKQTVYGATEWRLKNGIKVVVKPTDYQKEEVIIKMVNNGGKSIIATEDLPSFEPNVFTLWKSNCGLSQFPETKLSKMLVGKMASASPFIDDFQHGVQASGSPKDIETIFQLIYLTYAAPRFDENEFKPGMDQLRAVVPNIVKQPNFAFQKELLKTIYGNNPREFIISPEMLDKVDIKTIERVYKSLFSNAKEAVVTIVGNVNLDELKPLVEKYIGSIPTGKKSSRWVDPKTDIVKGSLTNHFETEMATPKTTVFMITSGDKKFTQENLIINKMVDYILDLIYTKSIREDEGGTYGVTSQGVIGAKPRQEYALQIVFDTDTEKAPKLIQIAKDGLKSLAEEGPSDDYLSKAKENMMKNISESRISNKYWSGVISRYYEYGIESDTLYEKTVNSITKEMVQAFVKDILDQGNFIEVVMNPQK